MVKIQREKTLRELRFPSFLLIMDLRLIRFGHWSDEMKCDSAWALLLCFYKYYLQLSLIISLISLKFNVFKQAFDFYLLPLHQLSLLPETKKPESSSLGWDMCQYWRAAVTSVMCSNMPLNYYLWVLLYKRSALHSPWTSDQSFIISFESFESQDIIK